MKKLKFIVLFLAVFMIFPLTVHAHEEDESDDVTEQQQAEHVEEDKRIERIDTAKNLYPVRLNEKEKANLSKRCSKAQDKLSKIATRLEVRSATTTTKYSRIELHLTAVQKRLAAQQIDTTVIDALIVNFQELVSGYAAALAGFQASLGDASTFDCATDPAAFKALLEDVRDKRKTFVDAVDAVKSFAKEDLKTGFDDLRTRLNTRGQE